MQTNEARKVVEELTPKLGQAGSIRLVRFIGKVSMQAQEGMAKRSEMNAALRRGYRKVVRVEQQLREFWAEFRGFQNHVDTEFKGIREHVDTEFKDVRRHMDAEFKDVRRHMDTEFKDMRREMQTGFQELRTEISSVYRKLLWGVGTIAGLIYTIEKLLA